MLKAAVSVANMVAAWAVLWLGACAEGGASPTSSAGAGQGGSQGQGAAPGAGGSGGSSGSSIAGKGVMPVNYFCRFVATTTAGPC